jgi:hypothetical protein
MPPKLLRMPKTKVQRVVSSGHHDCRQVRLRDYLFWIRRNFFAAVRAGTIARSFASIRIGGKVGLIGNLSGPATELNPGLIIGKRANVQGISAG